jgi:hypothetical protein
METLTVTKVPLASIERDPILPPRIIATLELEVLRAAMAQTGWAPPLIVRPIPGQQGAGPHYGVILGTGLWLVARELAWSHIDVIVRGDLEDDAAVLHQALQLFRTTEKLRPLEEAWYYARMAADGMTQASIAEREKISPGKANMYVGVGRAVTADRVAANNLDLAEVANVPITKLKEIADLTEEELDSALRAAVLQEAVQDPTSRPDFSIRHGRHGGWRAHARHGDLKSWTSEDLLDLISTLGPIVAEARLLAGIPDPAVGMAVRDLMERQRHETLAIREGYAERLLHVTEQLAEATIALQRARADVRVMGSVPAGPARTLIGWWCRVSGIPRRVRRAWDGVRSMFERTRSSIEPEPEQMAIQFDRGPAA